MEWAEMKGNGKLAAFTTIAVGPPLMTREGFDRKNWYCSGIVELDEGLKVSARIFVFDNQNPDKIKIGTPLTVEYHDWGEGEAKRTFLAFKA